MFEKPHPQPFPRKLKGVETLRHEDSKARSFFINQIRQKRKILPTEKPHPQPFPRKLKGVETLRHEDSKARSFFINQISQKRKILPTF